MLITWALAQAGIMMGGLDVIAPVLTMFFLATYGLINLACGLEGWAASPSFRPEFRIPSFVGILGGVACIYVMGIINLTPDSFSGDGIGPDPQVSLPVQPQHAGGSGAAGISGSRHRRHGRRAISPRLRYVRFQR